MNHQTTDIANENVPIKEKEWKWYHSE